MLSKKDKEWIAETFQAMIREEFRTALFREVTLVKGPLSGDQEARQETMTENLLDVLTVFLPKAEGALRGLQEDCNKVNNRSLAVNQAVEHIGKILMSNENTIKTLTEFAGAIRERISENINLRSAIGMTGEKEKKS